MPNRNDRHRPAAEPDPPDAATRLDAAAVDVAIDVWRQGDVLDTSAIPFVVLALSELPLSRVAIETAGADSTGDEILEVYTAERGLVVVAQTCDVVRSCLERPYVDVSPLVELDADDYREVERGRSVRYAVVSSLAQARLVADLDRTMTIEKTALARHSDRRVPGCRTDAERRSFASTLARRRGRFAFPDAFNNGLAKLVEHVRAKHGRDSAIGRFTAALCDIRVRCPDWESARPDVTMLFVFPTLAAVPADARAQVDALLKRFKPTAGFGTPAGLVMSLETMSAALHLESDALELEYVSRRPNAA